MIRIDLPVSEAKIRELSVGDEVLLNGRLMTARDMAHKYLVETRPDFLREVLAGSILYHCGPIVKKLGNKYEFVAAGPTTSIREEPYQGEVIAEYGVRGIIGKGGMGPRTLDALKRFGAVYLSAVGGLAAVLAGAVKEVEKVYMLEEFGTPEAMWVVRVEDFPAVVTMDSRGRSLHEEIQNLSEAAYKKLVSS
jgi:fumarate hydratase subunit beta